MKHRSATIFVFTPYLKDTHLFPPRLPAISTVQSRQRECHPNICFPGSPWCHRTDKPAPIPSAEERELREAKVALGSSHRMFYKTECSWNRFQNTALCSTRTASHGVGCQEWEPPLCLTAGTGWSTASSLGQGWSIRNPFQRICLQQGPSGGSH